jgi:hypothetical protein
MKKTHENLTGFTGYSGYFLSHFPDENGIRQFVVKKIKVLEPQ